MAIYNMKNQKELENKENKQEPIIKKTPIKEDKAQNIFYSDEYC